MKKSGLDIENIVKIGYNVKLWGESKKLQK